MIELNRGSDVSFGYSITEDDMYSKYAKINQDR